MICHAAIDQAKRPPARHVLSFASVTPEQEARGIHATCLRCEAELRDSAQWFSETCQGKQEEAQ